MAIERLLIAPSTSPISIALAVPIACEEVPMAIPFATGSVILKSLHKTGARRFPSIPVTIITAAVRSVYPPSSSVTPIPMAVVIDFGRNVTYSACVNPNIAEIARTKTRLARTPEIIPAAIAFQFDLSTSIFS